ncbi:MAG: phytanoyl-CoA dioxygenase family protein [Methylobacterium sp.]|nr:phytanoyl-CoA dioxygenase family protein [Methylobacterium sp.]
MHVSLTNDLKNSGNIAMFRVSLTEAERKGGGTLAVRDANGAVLARRPVAELPQDATVGAHMHRFAPGKNLLSFVIESGAGNWLSNMTWRGGAQGKEVTFDNPIKMTGLADRIAEEMRTFDVPTVFFGVCDSSLYPYRSSELKPWFDRDDAAQVVQAWQGAQRVDADMADRLRGFVKNGFIIFENLIDDALIDQINLEIDEAIAERHGGYEYGSSQRIEHLHFSKPGIQRLFRHEKLRDLASLLLESDARPSQTLTFVFGSQQDAHQDTIHLTPFPAGYMCGIWIALQDIQPGSGELTVYPGSHREPRVYMADAGCPKVTDGDWSEFGRKVVPIWEEIAARYPRQVYQPKKGTVLFWHENLLHSGSPREDKALERRAIVIHSFSSSAVVYYDSSGLVGTISEPELHLEDY